MNPSCPKCHQSLQKVRRPSNSMLNEDQFDSVRAGDWFCECHTNGRGNTSYAYFWDKEVIEALPASPVAEGESQTAVLAGWPEADTAEAEKARAAIESGSMEAGGVDLAKFYGEAVETLLDVVSRCKCGGSGCDLCISTREVLKKAGAL